MTPLTGTSSLTVAVLGTGRMAQIHLKALTALKAKGLPGTPPGRDTGLQIVLYGRDPAKVEQLARAFPVQRTYTNLESLWRDPEVQVVDCCLVNSLHFPVLAQAIDRGWHVFTEKPLTNRLEEAETLLQLACSRGVHHGIVQNMRFEPGLVRAREIIRAGELGRIFHVRGVFGYFVPKRLENRPAWFYDREQAGGGIVHDMMAHFFDLLSDLIGPIADVHCVTGTYFPEREDENGRPFRSEVEDAAAVLVEFESGAIGDLFASWVRRKHEEVPFFEIDGEQGSLLVSFHQLKIQRAEQTPLFRYDPTAVQPDAMAGWMDIPLVPVDPFEVQLGQFLAGVLTGQPVRPDWSDAVRTQQLIERAYASAQCRGKSLRSVANGGRYSLQVGGVDRGVQPEA